MKCHNSQYKNDHYCQNVPTDCRFQFSIETYPKWPVSRTISLSAFASIACSSFLSFFSRVLVCILHGDIHSDFIGWTEYFNQIQRWRVIDLINKSGPHYLFSSIIVLHVLASFFIEQDFESLRFIISLENLKIEKLKISAITRKPDDEFIRFEILLSKKYIKIY